MTAIPPLDAFALGDVDRDGDLDIVTLEFHSEPHGVAQVLAVEARDGGLSLSHGSAFFVVWGLDQFGIYLLCEPYH